jgi:splicing factor 3B subunit 1
MPPKDLSVEEQIKQAQAERQQQSKAFMSSVSYDQELYGNGDDTAYSRTIVEEEEDDDQARTRGQRFSAPKDAYMREVIDNDEEPVDELQQRAVQKRLSEREDSYKKQRLKRTLSPSRVDAFSNGGDSSQARSYAEVMQETELERERERTLKEISEKQQQEASKELESIQKGGNQEIEPAQKERKRRWDDQGPATKKSEWEDEEDSKPSKSASEQRKRSRWDETPVGAAGGVASATPSRRSRWDQTPVGKTGKRVWKGFVDGNYKEILIVMKYEYRRN